MTKTIDWASQIGRRVTLRDLHVFLTVVQRGSMAKAAAQLGVSQPAVSGVIAGLEHALGLRVLDRSRRGVEPTIYGRALLNRGMAAFDELKQAVRDMEFLADPSVGELRIGCPESISAAILPPIIQRFSDRYPGVVLQVYDVSTPTLELPRLRERELDLVIARLIHPPADDHFGDDLNVDVLFQDQLVVAAGKQSPWASRRKIGLAELINAPWILTPPNSSHYLLLAEAFEKQGLTMPKRTLTTFSVHLRANLVASGPFVAGFPRSVLNLNAERFSLKALPINLPTRSWPVALVTLKNRTLSPVVELFLKYVRNFTQLIPDSLASIGGEKYK